MGRERRERREMRERLGHAAATPAAVLAERLEAAARARPAAKAARAAQHRAVLEGLAGLSLDELRRHVTTRQWLVALYHVGGFDSEAIARAVGFTTGEPVRKALRHPVVARLVELVKTAQLERVLRGEFGVAAQAKAAAPAVMQHVAELAGGRPEADGTRRGRAKRDADAIRAADLVLTVSGDKIERTATMHVHLLEELSEAELEHFADSGEWPERYHGVAGMLPEPTPGAGP